MSPINLDDLITPNDNERMAFDCHNFTSKNEDLSNKTVPLPTALESSTCFRDNLF